MKRFAHKNEDYLRCWNLKKLHCRFGIDRAEFVASAKNIRLLLLQFFLPYFLIDESYLDFAFDGFTTFLDTKNMAMKGNCLKIEMALYCLFGVIKCKPENL